MFELLVSYLDVHKTILLVVIAVIIDLFFGLLRAFKEKRVNSSIGINGMIRKIGMIGGLVFLILIDFFLALNLIGWLPEQILAMFKVVGLEVIGISDLFSLLFVAFEILSIIKNWTLIGLPMFRGVNDWVLNFLETFTDEMPSTNKN